MDYEKVFEPYAPFSLYKSYSERNDTYTFTAQKDGKPFVRLFCFPVKTPFTDVVERIATELTELERTGNGVGGSEDTSV